MAAAAIIKIAFKAISLSLWFIFYTGTGVDLHLKIHFNGRYYTLMVTMTLASDVENSKN